MRGSHRSRQQADIVAEARALIADGVKEINLISQDSTYYGLDLRPNHSRAISSPEKFSAAAKSLAADATTICTLLRELNSLPGDFWIRLLYTHPAHWTDELIQTIAECQKVARYVDMPLQHIHENMLERMRRETSQQYIVDLIRKIRAGVPGIALRTTFIVGFPGRNRGRVLKRCSISSAKRNSSGWAYSPIRKEDGTRAGAMAGQISDQVKQTAPRTGHGRATQNRPAGFRIVRRPRNQGARRRRSRVRNNCGSANVSLLGTRLDPRNRISSLATQLKVTILVARGEADAPDIDGRVYIRGKLPLGEFARVKIIGHTDYDLIAEPAN